MSLISFREWLDKEQIDLPLLGQPNSNADEVFGLTGVKSKYAMTNTKSGQTDFDPDEKFFCGKKKNRGRKKN